MKSKTTSLYIVAVLACTCACVSCDRPHSVRGRQSEIDSLNQRAYGFRYSNIDSLRAISQEVCRLAGGFNEYALLNLSYAAYQQMDYWGADSLLNIVSEKTNNQIYQLCADVMRMKTAQRVSAGVAFFQAKRSAERRMARIEEERDELSRTEEHLFTYACSEYNIILSTYYYYQGNDSLAIRAIENVGAMNLSQDIAQWVYYNYMLGSGGLIKDSDPKRLTLAEFDHLVLAYTFSRRLGYIYFEANALQSLSAMYEKQGELIERYRHDDYKMLEAQNMSWADDDLALAMSNHAIYLFRTYDDMFQAACAYRSRGELHFGRGEYESSIDDYAQALHCVNLSFQKHYASSDTLKTFSLSSPDNSTEARWLRNPDILTIPEWIAGIRQHLSLSFSALGDKQASDYNRNAYLDILQNTNQNEELEARNQELRVQARATFYRLIVAIAVMLVMFAVAFLYRNRLRRRSSELALRLKRLQSGEETPPELAALDETVSELDEQIGASRHNLSANKVSNVEDRAKVSLVHAILPYLDRIGNEVRKMKRTGKLEDFSRQYIAELIGEIERCNEVLTEWIKIRQGELSPHITTVSLQRLFAIVGEGHYAFDQKGITLRVSPTQAKVKADEALTLFMINTLADNARKFTPEGGSVTLQTVEADDYVEVQVADTGCGLTDEEADALNNRDIYTCLNAKPSADDGQAGFGFGLMNCRGIMERYKKHSSIFACCAFGVRSERGRGSTFFFRLPRVVAGILLLLFSAVGMASPVELYDSVYQCNIEGRYDEALLYGGRALRQIDQHLALRDPMSGGEPRELLCYQRGKDLDYMLIMGLRNELALTALAINDWALYRYNNRIYTQLQKYVNQDDTLPEYCERLERFRQSGRLLLVFIIIFAAVALFLVYKLFIGSQLMGKKNAGKQLGEFIATQREEKERRIVARRDALARSRYEENRVYVQNQILDNCLSAVKHESMYYPSRIRQLAERMGEGDIGQLDELVSYYRNICTILCSQANEQLDKPSFKRQSLFVGELFARMRTSFQRAVRRHRAVEMTLNEFDAVVDVQGDSVLLDVLFDNLFKSLPQGVRRIVVSASIVGDFVDFAIHTPDVCPTESELHDMFHPAEGCIPLLVAKQIVREHDIHCGNPGLRLYAERQDAGYTIHFTLLRKYAREYGYI